MVLEYKALSKSREKPELRSSGTTVDLVENFLGGQTSFCIMPFKYLTCGSSGCRLTCVLHGWDLPTRQVGSNSPALHSAPSTSQGCKQRQANLCCVRKSFRASHRFSVSHDTPATLVCLWQQPASPQVFLQCFLTLNSPVEPP